MIVIAAQRATHRIDSDMDANYITQLFNDSTCPTEPPPTRSCEQLTIIYPCKTRPWQRKWYEETMFRGHTLVCFEAATAATVRDAQVVASAFLRRSGYMHGGLRSRNAFEVDAILLQRLRLPRTALAGKVLVHLDDEYGATRTQLAGTGTPDDVNYCRLYAGFTRVFRPYWSRGWAALAAGPHGEMRGCTVPCALPPPRVEWTPLGWSSNWERGEAAQGHNEAAVAGVGSTSTVGAAVAAVPPTHARSIPVAFYGNAKHQMDRGAMFRRFEAGAKTGKVHTTLTKHKSFGTGNKTDYRVQMLDTQTCLQLPGLSAECYRLYESIDAGCIPVFSWDLPGRGYDTRTQHAFLLGDMALPSTLPSTTTTPSSAALDQHQSAHESAAAALVPPPPGGAPFVHADTVAELAAPLQALLSNATRLDMRQEELRTWWAAALDELRNRIVGAAMEATGCAKPSRATGAGATHRVLRTGDTAQVQAIVVT